MPFNVFSKRISKRNIQSQVYFDYITTCSSDTSGEVLLLGLCLDHFGRQPPPGCSLVQVILTYRISAEEASLTC